MKFGKTIAVVLASSVLLAGCTTDKKEIKAYLKQVDKIKDDEEPIKTVGKKIAELDEKKKKLTEDVNSQDEEIAKRYGLRSGVGLAAPQINISKRMIAVLIPDDGSGKSYDYMLVNPKIVSHSVQEAYLPTGEGCLSVDDNVAGLVHRHNRITIKAKDIEGNDIQLRLKGYPAIVFQHEIDHLNGVMFYDHIDKDHPLQPHTDAVEV